MSRTLIQFIILITWIFMGNFSLLAALPDFQKLSDKCHQITWDKGGCDVFKGYMSFYGEKCDDVCREDNNDGCFLGSDCVKNGKHE